MTMKKIALIVLFCTTAAVPATADKLTIITPGATVTSHEGVRLGPERGKELFDTYDFVAYCVEVDPQRKALVLRVHTRFYAINGHARSYLAGIGARARWLRTIEAEIEDYPANREQAMLLQGMITPGLASCAK